MAVEFRYRAVTTSGDPREGIIPALSEDQAASILQGQGLLPIEIRPAHGAPGRSIFRFRRGPDHEKLILFTSSLMTMYRAGIPILRALSIIRIGGATGRFNAIIDQIREGLQSGRQLSESMAEHPDLFSDVYTASVSAGEESGKLDQTLAELADMLEKEHDLNRQIKSAVRYPVIVLAIIAIAVFVVMSFVVPRFVDFYGAFDAELPLPTRIIIGLSGILSGYWPIVLGLAAAAFFVFRKVISRPDGRLWFDRRLLHIPVLGDLVIKGNIARFCLMFRILFKSGLPLVRSLSILSKTVRNKAIGQEVELLEETVRQGIDIKSTASGFQYFPDLALQMIAVGLESGNLDGMLEEVGRHYSRQVMYTARQLTSIIEPILTLVLGLFVLVLALAIFLPMWNLIRVFNG